MASVRLPENLDKKLDSLCLRTKRTKSFYIKEALEMYLEDVEDYYTAVERAARPNRKTLTNAEMLEAIRKMK